MTIISSRDTNVLGTRVVPQQEGNDMWDKQKLIEVALAKLRASGGSLAGWIMARDRDEYLKKHGLV